MERQEQSTEARGDMPSVKDRRQEDRQIWQAAFMISVGLHLLLFLLWPSGGGPVSPFSAPGAPERDEAAAEGMMRAVSVSAAPADPVTPPPAPTLEIDLPEPPDTEPDASPEMAMEEPDVPQPGPGGLADQGQDEEPTGVSGGSGAGDAGTGEEGLTRLIPPTPRGMIIPPTNRSLRGTEIEVWVFVDQGGRVVADSTRLEPPTSDRSFNEQLKREAAQWVFQPARRGTEVVEAWFPYTITM